MPNLGQLCGFCLMLEITLLPVSAIAKMLKIVSGLCVGLYDRAYLKLCSIDLTI
jgi:hypothetical protein